MILDSSFLAMFIHQVLPGFRSARNCQYSLPVCQKMPYLLPACQKLPYLLPVCQKLPYLLPVCHKLPYLLPVCQKLLLYYYQITSSLPETATVLLPDYFQSTRNCYRITTRLLPVYQKLLPYYYIIGLIVSLQLIKILTLDICLAKLYCSFHFC